MREIRLFLFLINLFDVFILNKKFIQLTRFNILLRIIVILNANCNKTFNLIIIALLTKRIILILS